MPRYKVHPALRASGKVVVIGPAKAKSRTFLGRLAEFGPQRELWLGLESEHVIAIVGKRGSGKTHTLGVLVEGLTQSNVSPPITIMDPSREHAVVVFDTLNLFQ